MDSTCEAAGIPAIKIEAKEEVTSEENEISHEDKDEIWPFPSYLIQDVAYIKEEVKDEITVEERGVWQDYEEESEMHSPYKSLTILRDTVDGYPVRVEMTEDLISQDYKNTHVNELGGTSLCTGVQHEEELTSAIHVDVDHHDQELCQNNAADKEVIDGHEEVFDCTKKGVKRGKVYPCEMCNKAFMYPSNLDNHIRMIHRRRKSLDREIKLQEERCVDCGVKLQEESCEIKLQNESCEMKLRKKSSKIKSKKRSQPEKIYECEMCREQLHGYVQFIRHSPTHIQPISSHRVICKLCGEIFSRCYFSKVHCHIDHSSKVDYAMKDFYFF